LIPPPHILHVQPPVPSAGSVIHGMEVLDSLEKVPVEGKKHRPTVDIKLERVTIHANPFAT
jgi:peptidyl-prolyl cis-trans isomerase-like 3